MKKIYLFMLMAVGLLISGNLRAEKTLVAEMTALEQTTSFYWEEGATGQGNVYASAYDALTAALAALPENSTPATVKLFEDVKFDYETDYLKITKYQNVTIDLNGKTIAAATGAKKSSQLIDNKGTLTIDDSSDDKDGLISNCPYGSDKSEIPGYGSYTILNVGTLILNNGTIENGSDGKKDSEGKDDKSSGGACYCVENHISHNNVSPSFIMNGGKLIQSHATAVRMYIQNPTDDQCINSVTINGGEIIAKGFGVTTHYLGATKKQNIIFTMNDGKLESTGNDAYASWATSGTNDFSNTKICINGGTIIGPISLGNISNGTAAGQENLSITSGIFKNQPFLKSAGNQTQFITGGVFCNFCTSSTITIVFNDNDYSYYHFKTDKYTRGDFQSYLNTCDVKEWGGSYWEIYNPDASDEGDNEVLAYVEKSAYPDKDKLLAAARGAEIQEDEDNGEWIAVGEYDGGISPHDEFQSPNNPFIAEGYKAVECSDFGHPETDLKIGVVGEKTKTVTEDITLKPEDCDNLTDLTIENNGTSEKTTVTIAEGTKVEAEKLTVTSSQSAYGEAQIVVSTGATLKLGNGGLVSENMDITTVLVEPGGTFIIGVGGVTDKGDATPIEVKNNAGNGAGVVLFNPNSKEEATQRYAEVDLYTYSKQVGDGKYTWQHFAVPVTGIADEGKFKPVASEDVYSYIFDWDYKTYSWHQLDAWSKLNTPFAGYDITNESANGGVVYTFKGDLIGNQNTQLTLPNKNYCVMGNSYTAPIDLDALFDQIKKEMDQEGQDIIEQTVYKYDAKKKYYVWTNKLGLELAKAGILDPEFVDIKPMEGFLLNLQNGNTAGVMLNYANAVFNPAMDKANGIAQAPRMNRNTDLVIAKINVTSAHSTDLVTLVEGDEFSAAIENGKDAFKYLNEGANLYAFDGTNKLAMVATNNLEGTMLAFQAAEDAEYTLTFDRALNADYTLVDLQNGNEVEMIEGNSYTFTATPNSLNPSRFMVIASAQAPTKMNPTKASKVAKGIYTMAGQYLGNAETFNAMPQGVYMVNGVKVIK